MSWQVRAVPRSRQQLRLVMAAVLALAVGSLVHAQPQWHWSGAARIVVVADIHGAYPELLGLLQAAGVIDASLDWSGGDTTLVSLGDLLDRGGRSREVMDLLMRLQRDAPARGGAVHVVLGNHEVMNLIGDLRYVSPAEYAAFAAEESAELRASAYRRFVLEQTAASTDEEQVRAAFEQLYPPGYFGHRRAFRADGPYGAWLLSLPALIVIDDTAFVHGGLPGMVADTSAAAVNRGVQDGLRRYLAVRDQLADAGLLPPMDMQRDMELAGEALRTGAAADLAPLIEELLMLGDMPELGIDGPLWYRGAIYCSPLLERRALDAALERLGAARVVVGHTPTEGGRARELYDGRLITLDTGMLAEYYGGRPAALVIEGERIFVQYSAPEEQLPLERGRSESYGMTEAEILAALAAGSIETRAGAGASGTVSPVSLRHGEHVMRAAFYSARGGEYELAAYRLDRLLDAHLVPPTVAREFDGRAGALQLEYPDVISEAQRLEQGLPLAGWCPLNPQLRLMQVFDALIHNTGRTQSNLFYRRDFSAVKLVDHGRAFGAERQVRFAGVLPQELEQALAALDQQSLQAELGQWLNTARLRALLARRDSLLERLQ